jgi:hypothetical protein
MAAGKCRSGPETGREVRRVTADLTEYLSSDRATKRPGGTGKRGSDLAPCWQGHVRRGATPVRSVVRRGAGSRYNIERASRSTHSH